jgi:hypothetical protein
VIVPFELQARLAEAHEVPLPFGRCAGASPQALMRRGERTHLLFQRGVFGVELSPGRVVIPQWNLPRAF